MALECVIELADRDSVKGPPSGSRCRSSRAARKSLHRTGFGLHEDCVLARRNDFVTAARMVAGHALRSMGPPWKRVRLAARGHNLDSSSAPLPAADCESRVDGATRRAKAVKSRAGLAGASVGFDDSDRAEKHGLAATSSAV